MRRTNTQNFSGITISGSRQSFIGAMIAQAAICPHFQITRLGFFKIDVVYLLDAENW